MPSAPLHHQVRDQPNCRASGDNKKGRKFYIIRHGGACYEA